MIRAIDTYIGSRYSEKTKIYCNTSLGYLIIGYVFLLFQYLTYCLILVLISCGVYQMMISVLKMVILTVCGLVYVLLVHSVSAFLFDLQDELLQNTG